MTDLRFLALAVTGRCNFRCRYCYASEIDGATMSVETASQALALLRKEQEPCIVQLTGGEPLLAWDTIQGAVAYGEAHGLPIRWQIQTNGSLLTTEMARYLYQHKVAIGISIDGKPSVTDRLRLNQAGKGASAEILRGFYVLKELGYACGITCVVTKENVKDLVGCLDLAYYLGNVRRIGFDILRGQGRGPDLVPPSGPDMDAAMRAVYERNEWWAKRVGYRIRISQLDRVAVLDGPVQEEFGHCYAMNAKAAFVDASGHIYACASYMDDPAYAIGHVSTGLVREKQAEVGARLKAGMDFCKSCPDFADCGGGCYARWEGTGRKEPCASECAMKRQSIAVYRQSKRR